VRTASLVALYLLCLRSTVAAEPPPLVERGLLPGEAGVAAAAAAQQDHAAARGGDLTLVVWSDYRGRSVGGGTAQSDADVLGIRLDAQGAPVDETPFLIAGGMGLQRYPLVAWNGEAWLVVYISQDPVGSYYEHRMRAVRVAADGSVLDADPIAFPPTQFTPNTVGLEVAGQGGQWLVTRCIYHDTGYGTFLAGQRIGGDGSLLDADPIVLLDWVYGATRTIASNGEYLVAGPDWTTSSTIKAIRVGLDAQPVGASFEVPSLVLAGDGSEYYVVWIANFVDLVGSRMTTTGTLLTPGGTPIVPGASPFTHSTLAHDGTRWWLEWGAADQLRTVRIDAAGNVLDPGGGVLLPIVIGGSVNTAYDVALVPRTGGGAQVLWYDLRVALGNDANVFVLPVAAGNLPGTERCVSTGTRSERTPDFAEGPGEQAAVTFVSEAANDDRVVVHFLDADGFPITSEPVEVATGATIGRSAIAWNGSTYLVVWDDSGVKARRLDANGAFLDATPIDVMPGFNADVAALGQDFCVIASKVESNPQFINVYFRRVDGGTGSLLDGSPVPVGASYSYNARIHADGTRCLATWERHPTHDDPQSSAQYSFIEADGSHTPEASVNSPFTSSGGQPDVATTGDRRLFVWRSNSLSNANNYIRGRLMNADGSWASDFFTIAEAPGRQLRPVVGWDGTSFVVAWDDQRNQAAFFDERTDVYGARVTETGTVLDPGGFPIYAGPQGDATAAILSRTDGVSFVASARFETDAPLDSYRVGITVLGSSQPVDVAELSTPGAWLRQNVPNPVGPRTRIEFGLARPEPARLAIYDVTGRLVRTLVDDPLARAGTHSVTWDARDTKGAPVAAGAYWYVLSTPTRHDARRLAVLR